MKTMSLCVRLRRDLCELLGGDAVVHDADQGARRADLGDERVPAVPALEQEQLGAAHQHLFERQVDEADRRRATVMQAAAMRRVDADELAAREPRIGATLGAVAVQDVDAAPRGRVRRCGAVPRCRSRRCRGSSARA